MLEKRIVRAEAHTLIAFGKVYNETVEYYKSSTKCYARGNELRKDSTIAYVLDAYDYKTGYYKVDYAYKA